MPDPGLQIALDLMADGEACRVIGELSCWYDEKIPYARQVAQDLGIPVEQLHRILRRLIEGGYATYGPLYREDDGMPMGSSYWLTEAGEQLRYHMPKLASAVTEK
ncbi:hypothetical protein HT136_01510 [Novosphingobium profundi]|uniref:hypothetical protein n=1 Tax=Novosphingobium profundi TaxID=1774954 RepID=UPI001BDA21D9|nr:hypothetical protein [Novosphingobium profundi]MBT0667044.1 hypothetical protein [Novosphingobium profundi]